MSRRRLSRVLDKIKYYSYRLQLYQAVYDRDLSHMVEFCLWILERSGEVFFFYLAMLSDESTIESNDK